MKMSDNDEAGRIRRAEGFMSNSIAAPWRDEGQAKAYLAAIIESSSDAIISKNLDGTINSWNKAAEKLFGYKAEEAVGRHITLIIPPERHDEEHTIISKIRAGQRVEHFETVRQTKDGRMIDLSITVSPIKNDRGEVIGASKIARDITERIKTAKELAEANRKKDEFLAGISHELRTPMNAIVGLSQILARSERLNQKEQDYVSTLKRSADNLLDLINDLLDISKIEAGAFELESVELNLSELIIDTTKSLKVTAALKGLALDTVFKSQLAEYYWGDPLRIQQVLTNLISNAIKFTEEGVITVSIASEDKGEHTLVTLDISDTGIGIPADKIDKIFEKFVQADSSITRKYGGSGLGLAITKAYVEKMGGTISVDSEINVGTRFIVVFPLHKSSRGVVVHPDALSRKPAKNILIVEDYEPNVVVATAMLDLLNLSYDVASGGLEAVKCYIEGKYDAVLMDVQMHNVDGLDATRQIRQYEAEEALEQTPIIAVTAHVQESDKNRCLAVGMNDFIAKPFSLDLLEAKLATYTRTPPKVTLARK